MAETVPRHQINEGIGRDFRDALREFARTSSAADRIGIDASSTDVFVRFAPADLLTVIELLRDIR